MRLLLDITKTRDGRYEGSMTDRQDFAGILELLARVRLSEGCVIPGCSGHAMRPRSAMLSGA